ncbi:hypothetical protein [Geopsychrobacter electrodiphilus]|uniref:hypothetical protein n=1 Tax=Geopsychrobacter electrodiphilus TaxID=225196 RepID=UPI000363F2C5|nr:hypothetical protein [Geopsychrobacter electrodiphilus]
MNKKQIKNWEATRSKGKKRFVLISGVLNWGVLTAILWSLVMSYTSGSRFLNYFLIAIVVFPIGGVLFGHVTWNFMEKKYLKEKSKKTK